MTSEIRRIIRRHRDELEDMESAARMRVLTIYERIIASLEGDLLAALEAQQAVRARGGTASWWQMRQEMRVRNLLDQVERQMQSLVNASTYEELMAQSDITRLAHQQVIELAEAQGYRVEATILDRLPARAVEAATAAFGPDSPLQQSLALYAIDTRQIIQDAVINGIAEGQSARTAYNQLRDQLLDGGHAWRLETLVRTETMRAYREQHDTDYAVVDDAIVGYAWSAAHSVRTCKACLAMSGQVFPKDAFPDRFHPNCRCRKIAVFAGFEDVAVLETGERWLARQSFKTQSKVIRKPEALTAYRRGEVTLGDYVGVRTDPAWGESVFAKSDTRVLREKGLDT